MEAMEHQEDLSLVSQLDAILASDPFIDELGFVHPSQLASLRGTSLESVPPDTSVFWCEDHKLAIAVTVMPTLYKAAKSAFLATRRHYECCLKSANQSECGNFEDLPCLEEKLMTYTRVLVIINSGHRSAWNTRKQILKVAPTEVLAAELQLSSLALSYDPKSEEAWAHRRWVIIWMIQSFFEGKMPEYLLQGELKLVELVAERSRMNYRAWRHCCWLVAYMSSAQILFELQRWKKWAQLHVADNCCFHFRRCLFQRLLDNSKSIDGNDTSHAMNVGDDIDLSSSILQDELQWNEDLIKLYLGREALWVHRRFLFYIWIQYVKPGVTSVDCVSSEGLDKCSSNLLADDSDNRSLQQHQFLEKEIHLVDSCISTCGNDKTEDAHRQHLLAATYKLWVLLKWRESNALTPIVSEVCQQELSGMEEALKDFGPHWINLWAGLFGQISHTLF